jgi:hypothetical protein
VLRLINAYGIGNYTFLGFQITLTLQKVALLQLQGLSLLGSPSRCAPVKHKVGEKYSQAQQYILQLYNFHRMLIFLRHVSTHFPSHRQALHNLRLITVKYLRKCVRDLIGLQYLSK